MALSDLPSPRANGMCTRSGVLEPASQPLAEISAIIEPIPTGIRRSSVIISKIGSSNLTELPAYYLT